jgi:CSLREA domain-containing protein
MALPWLALLPLALGGHAMHAAPEDTLNVNSQADMPDAAVGDGACETAPGNGICTLRAAIQEASAFANPDTINVPAGTYDLTRTGADDTAVNGDLDLVGPVTLRGAGPAATIIDANAINDRVFHVFTGTTTIAGVTLQNGRANNAGGAVFVRLAATLTLSDTLVTGNSAGHDPGQNRAVGGGIYNVGSLTLISTIVSSNSVTNTAAQPAGGGIFNLGAFTMTGSLIQGNVTLGSGGGLSIASGEAVIDGSTLSGNQARFGGGIESDSPDLQLVNSTLSANRADRDGGGLYVEFGQTRLYNVTVTGNQANAEEDGTFSGGGLRRAGPGTITLLNSLVAGNSRTVWSDPVPLLENNDCAGTLNSAGANYVGDLDLPCVVTGTAPLTGGFAGLGPLADNGGPTPTHALRPGSPAIDAGEAGGCTGPLGVPLLHDQRGTTRPLLGQHNRRCDLGAFEYVPPVLVPFVGR